MVRKILPAIILLLSFNILFANSEKEIKTELEKLTLFFSGAELTHSSNVKLDRGITDLVFEGLADRIDPNTIQVSAKGDLIILSVTHRLNYLKSRKKSPRVIELEDSLKLFTRRLKEMNNDEETYKAELALILANQNLSGENNVTVAELKKMTQFYRTELPRIKTELLNIGEKIVKVQKEIEKLNNQLDEVNRKRNKPVNEVVVSVSTDKKVESEFTISYYMFDAGWGSSYDIRVADINSKVKLNYKAHVWQNSGIDWNDIKITLSTRNPRRGGTKPEVNPWFIDFQEDMYRDEMESMQKSARVYAAQNNEAEEAQAPSMAEYMQVVEKQMAIEYTPSLTYTIPSDGRSHFVDLEEMELPAEYEYYAAPKFDKDAFLVAYVTEWNDYNLLPGKANIYFENSFVGSSFINPTAADKKLIISLGRDKNISIVRELKKDFTEDKFLSSDIERIFAYEILIRNNKSQNIVLVLEEPIPISQHEDIVVEVIEKSGAEFNKNEGIIKWKLNIAPNENVKKNFTYSVRYPKDKTIPNL